MYQEILIGSLLSFEFDNLFNYGEDKVNFEDLDGIIGIFGKNFSGKSSIIDGVYGHCLTPHQKMNARISMLLIKTKKIVWQGYN